jgi:hypothetical protein
MNPPPAALSKDVSRAHSAIRSSELPPARARERLVQRVRAARKTLAANSGRPFAKIR